MLRGHRPPARTIRSVVVVVALLVVVAVSTPTLGAFTGVISGSGSTTASSLVLTSAPTGGSTCTSTGGTGQFSSDSATCSGSVWPATQLSGVTGTAESLATTFSTVGGSAPTSASAAIGSPGLEASPDGSGNGDDGFAKGGVSFGASGPLSASAASFNGSSGMLETQQKINDPGPSYTLAAWFRVASGYSSGGGIIGFQSAQNGASTPDDRKLWMDNSGHIAAGEYTSTYQVATSAGTYNDGSWHFAVASFSASAGLTLYVESGSSPPVTDSVTNSNATSAYNYAGYWTIGYQNGSGWSPVPSSYYLKGSLAEVAVFPTALTSAQVTTLYNGGSGTEASFETRAQADNPSEFWPLQTATATTNLPDIKNLPDISGNNNLGQPQSGVTPSDQGPFGSDGAMYFDGATDHSSYVETSTQNSALPASFTIAAWFNAPSGSSSGGGILTLDSSQTGGGANHDPLLWMDDSGKIVAGTWPGANQATTSPKAYNDGDWHFAVATVSAAGLSLYIDGNLVQSNSSGTSGGSKGGYWLIGQGDEANWSDPPTDVYWTGELAHAAYFASALSSGQISTLYSLYSSKATVSAFEAQMLAYSPTYYWPLTDSGTTESASYPFYQVEPDSSGDNDNATAVGSTITLGVPGPFTTSPSYAASFDGNSGYLETASSITSPDTFTLVAWFKAPSHSTGGGIIGFDDAQSGTDITHDRTIWMDNSGKIVAGISGGSGVEATSSSAYDDGAWHLVVATFTPSTLTLYVDGAQPVQKTSGISDVNYTGYWSIGYVVGGGWADVPSTKEWDGSLADVAVIPSAISSNTVSTIYTTDSSQAALASYLSSLSPTAYWPLSSPATTVTDAGGIEISVQAANNGTTTCLFPAAAGSCPSLNESDFLPGSSLSSSTAAPTSTHSTTLTLSGEEPTAAPSPFAGLDFAVPFDLTGSLDSWTAALNYSYATFLL